MNPLGYDLVTFWVPLLAGIAGCMTGALALWLQYAGHRKDRPRVIVEVALRVRDLYPPRADWEFRVVNTGRRPVTLRRPVFKVCRFGKGPRLLRRILPGIIRPHREFNKSIRLDEQAAETVVLHSSLPSNELSFFPGDIARVGVEDESGKIWYAKKIDGLKLFLTVYSLAAVEEEQFGDLGGDRGTYVGRFARLNRHYVVGFSSLSGRVHEVHLLCSDESAAAGAYEELLQQAAAFRRSERTELNYKIGAGCGGGGGSGPLPAAQFLHWLNLRKVKTCTVEPPTATPD